VVTFDEFVKAVARRTADGVGTSRGVGVEVGNGVGDGSGVLVITAKRVAVGRGSRVAAVVAVPGDDSVADSVAPLLHATAKMATTSQSATRRDTRCADA